ncbi:SDR family NAD(P)-dependent oxidoreductase [Rhodopila sp.]|uniref:SDR family NAD(P)-dependent oxidoreductase n=1 Tax=Rhodopila sp. TaxID=2480087 RepID=UPI002C7ACA1A|nr:glucose 1-dehydrogenase [Rhodopila sp.]HVZ07995.1 glucose 1-dehydrogenase [Rhodopila sp.]
MNLFDLRGKVAVITGGNGGIGLGMARGIASCGANIVVVGRNAEKAASALDSLRELGVEAVFVSADVTRKADCVAMIAQSVQALGRVDILVNNAGTSIRKMPEDYSEEEWHHVLDTNLTSAFLASQAAYPALKQAGGGKIINIGSMMSLFGAPYATPYASSKGGIVQMSRALATAWAKDNIQVNAVLPGWIDTDLTKRARQQVDGLHESVEKRTPFGRWGTPHDMAGVAAFLASPASDFVTGTAIPVDGGFSVAM